MKTNRKGFTITELVIVIVVIAILAAVLIPTFSSLIKKANVSADTQVAKNLNTALTMSEAEGKKIETFGEALAALRENGYVVANLNPTAQGHLFAWESESNQILLVDGEKDYKVVYKSKDLKNAQIGETWWFAVNDDELKTELEGKGAKVYYAPKNAEQLKEALSELFGQTGAVKDTIVVSDDIELNDATAYKLNNKDAEITLEMGGKTVSTPESIKVRPYDIDSGTLNVSGGTIIAGGAKATNPTNNTDGAGTGSYGSFWVKGADSVLNLEDMTLQNSRPWGLNLKAQDGATINIKDTVITSSYGGGIEASASTIIVENTTITQTGYHDHCSTCVAVSGMGNLIVKSGTFNAENYGVYVFSSGGTIQIEGGSFNKTGNNSKSLIQLSEDKNQYPNAEAKVIITGGTFNGTDFKSLTEAQWKALCGNDSRISVSGIGTSTVTIVLN